jgi:hypothetical protein
VNQCETKGHPKGSPLKTQFGPTDRSMKRWAPTRRLTGILRPPVDLWPTAEPSCGRASVRSLTAWGHVGGGFWIRIPAPHPHGMRGLAVHLESLVQSHQVPELHSHLPGLCSLGRWAPIGPSILTKLGETHNIRPPTKQPQQAVAAQAIAQVMDSPVLRHLVKILIKATPI